MPLFNKFRECGRDGCGEETPYYKIVWIPYPEGIRVSDMRGARGKEAHLFLCPEHYAMPEGEYVIRDVTVKVEHTETYR